MSGNYWLNEIQAEKEITERWLPPQSDENFWPVTVRGQTPDICSMFSNDYSTISGGTNNEIVLKTGNPSGDCLVKNGEEWLVTTPDVASIFEKRRAGFEPISIEGNSGDVKMQCGISSRGVGGGIPDNMNYTIENVDTIAGRAVGSEHEFAPIAPIEINWGTPPLCNVTITCHEPIVNLSVDNLPTLKFKGKFQEAESINKNRRIYNTEVLKSAIEKYLGNMKVLK